MAKKKWPIRISKTEKMYALEVVYPPSGMFKTSQVKSVGVSANESDIMILAELICNKKLDQVRHIWRENHMPEVVYSPEKREYRLETPSKSVLFKARILELPMIRRTKPE